MRMIVLIFFLPFFVYANCGCEEVDKAIARERQEDTKYHGCRNCNAVAIDIDVSACPDFGYECNVDWKIAPNFLSATDTCRCAEARCAGTGRLAIDKAIVNKMRCNNSQWIVGEKAAKPVVCAKSCDTGVCKASHPRASAEYKPLKVMSSDAENRCSRGVCEPGYVMVALNAEGSLFMPLPGVSEVTCTGEGIWSSVGPYVMCKEDIAGCNLSGSIISFYHYDIPTCNARFAAVPVPNTCSEATFTPLEVKCGPGLTIVIVGPGDTNPKPGFMRSIRCNLATRKWIFQDPPNANGGRTYTEEEVAVDFGNPAGLACGTGEWWP